MSRDIRVFKFGGASVKDADAVVNVAEIIRQHVDTDLIIVVSAMGKTTNKLEDIFNAFVTKDKSAFDQKTQALKQFHLDIVENLFGNAPNRKLQQCIEEYFDEINDFYEQRSDEVSHLYDKLIPYGEILSTKIIHFYLVNSNINSHWLDARKCIKTDTNYQKANVNWPLTTERINNDLTPLLKENQVVVSQGFIGSAENNSTTTLGREGSDYSAGIFAYAVHAKEVII